MPKQEFPSPAKNTPEAKKMPYQRWYPVTDLYRNAPDKKQFMDAMKKGGININGENITPLDFFSTGSDLNDEEIIEAIQDYLGGENLDGKTELINQSLEKSKDYIENYLHRKLPKEIENLERLKNVNDLVKIFKKTSTAKKGEGVGLSPAYCALISVAAASFEFRKKEMDGLIKESAYLYEEMFRLMGGVQNFHRLRSAEGGYDRIMVFDDTNNNTIYVDSYFRGKNEDGFVTKFINEPEETAEKASKDGIGFKFEAKSVKDVEKLVPFFTEYFTKKFGAGNFVFENTKLLDSKGINGVRERIERGTTQFLITDRANPRSNPNFRSFKINGALNVPMAGDPSRMKIKRNFEIQIVLTDNSNETGFSNHFVYEGAKKLSAATRLFGSFTREYLDIICEEAGAGSKLSGEKIKNYFKENLLAEIKVAGSEKKRYATKYTAERFSKTGRFTEEIKIKKIR